MRAMSFYWKMWDKKEYTLEKQSLRLLWDAMKHGDSRAHNKNWVRDIVLCIQHWGYKTQDEAMQLLQNRYSDTDEGLVKKIKGGREGFFQNVQIRTFRIIRDNIRKDEGLVI